MKRNFTLLSKVFFTCALFGSVTVYSQNPGTLDNTFGTSGKVLSDLYYNQEARDIAIQPDGKIVIAGSNKVLSSGADYNFYVSRFNPDGTIDLTFGTNGTGTVSIDIKGISMYDTGDALVIQSDGKIVIAGSAGLNNDGRHAAFARLNANGTLDTTFGIGGQTSFPIGNDTQFPNARIYEMQLQTDGKIVAVGSARNSSTSNDFAIVRLNIDGSLDTDFSNDGKHTVNFGDYADVASHLAILPDGKIMVAGNSGEDLGLIRLFDDGSLDSTFGTAGKMTIPTGTGSYYLRGMGWQPDGKIVTAGTSLATNSNIILQRFNADGTVDATFGTNGRTETDIDSGSEDDPGKTILFQPDGKIIVTGEVRTGSTTYFAVLRYTNSGILDTTFSNDGQILTSFGVGFSAAYSSILQPDGKLLVTGTYGYSSQWDVAIARYHTGITTLGINYNQLYKIAVYPNPASQILQISGTALANKNYKVSDVSGKVFMNGVFNPSQQIDVSELAKGIYFLTTDNVNAVKFIKN